MKQIKHTALALLTILLVNCSDDDYSSSSITPTPLRIQATIDNTGWGDATRADDDTESTTTEKSAFADGDVIGISSSSYTNIPYTYKNGSWEPSGDEAIYFDNMYETFVAYYPYDVDKDKYADVTAKDLLTVFSATSTPTSVKDNNNITFRFKHVVSKLKLDFIDSNGDRMLDASDGIDVMGDITISGLDTIGTFDIVAGAAVGSGGDNMVCDSSKIYGTEILVFPHDGTFNVSFTSNYAWDDYDYTQTSSIYDVWVKLLKCIPVTVNIEAGKSYSYTFNNLQYWPRVGDYVLSDGSILSRNGDPTNSITENDTIIGVVFWVDDNHLKGYNYYCEKETYQAPKIVPFQIHTAAQDIFRFQHDGLMISLKDLSYNKSNDLSWGKAYSEGFSTTTGEEIFKEGMGYVATSELLDYDTKVSSNGETTKTVKDNQTSDIIKAIKDFESLSFERLCVVLERKKLPAESMPSCHRTAWYVPSIYELKLLYEAEEHVTESLKKLGVNADVIKGKNYLSSSWNADTKNAYYYNPSGTNSYYSNDSDDATTHPVRIVSGFGCVSYVYIESGQEGGCYEKFSKL